MASTIVTDLAGWRALPEVQLPEIDSPEQQGTVYLVKKVGFLLVLSSELPPELNQAIAQGNKRLLPTALVEFGGQDRGTIKKCVNEEGGVAFRLEA